MRLAVEAWHVRPPTFHPALAQQMIAVLDVRIPEEIVEFVQVNLPGVGTFVAPMGGAAGAELIVMDDDTATIGRVGIVKERIVCRSWPAVNNEKWNAI